MKKTTLMLSALMLFVPLTAWAAMLEGTVQRIDKSKKQVILNTADGRETIEINNATKGANSVKAGDKVQVTYSKNGQKLVASAIVENKNKSGATMFPSDRPETSPKGGSKLPMGVR
jgi:hypothetical protein